MKVVNIMNFVRQIDERKKNSTAQMLDFTKNQLRLLNEYGLDNTFLLQYDALCDDDFVSLFKNEATDKTEIGLWYEIVEPMTTACGMPYKSEMGWKWDWHIIPGYSMGYTPREREALIDETMRKFREVFGYYPKTIAAWVIDTHTLRYLNDHYNISCAAICRDEVSTDAYTLMGGYFNQAYYPSRNNMFTPAQTKEMQMNIPMFRLLGPCPIHNYDGLKYCSDEIKQNWTRAATVFTLEAGSNLGKDEKGLKWMFDSYYNEESLGFAYSQIGQENSFFFWQDELHATLKMQIDELLKRGDVKFMKMCDTGEEFKRLFPESTPPTALSALNNFDSVDIQSIYYDSKNYTANIFRYEDKIFLRSFFLFDEKIEDQYNDKVCSTFDAVYENLPVIDTLMAPVDNKDACGLMIQRGSKPFTAEKASEGVLNVGFDDGSVTFYEDKIAIKSDKIEWYKNSFKADYTPSDSFISFNYKGNEFKIRVEGAKISDLADTVEMISENGSITLYPEV